MNKIGSRIVLHIVVIVIAVMAVFPFVWTIISSTHTNTQIFNLSVTFVPENNFIANFNSLAEEWPIWRNLLNSILIAIIATGLVMLIDSMAAFGFTKYHFKFRDALFFVCLATMMIPTQVTMVPLFIQMTRLHWVNTPTAVIAPALASVFGVFLMRQNLMQFPDELIESGRIDGASDLSIFFRIVVPTIRSSFASLGILTFIAQWGNYLWPLIVLNQRTSYTLPLVLSLMVAPGEAINYGAIMVGAVIVLIPVLVFFLIFQKNFINGMLGGAIKG